MNPDPRRPRLEGRLILALTLLGGVVRAWGFPSIGLDHFDEGIYVMVARQILAPPRGAPWIDATATVYAPPGYPMLVALGYLITGVSDRGAILVSWLAGTLTVPLAGWVGRRWIGPGAGASTAALAALCGPQIVFSRMGLTDATHLLAWLAALAVGARFLDRPTASRAIALGVAVGVAQLFKYSGWVAGAVVAVAVVPGLLAGDPALRSRSRRGLAMGLFAAATSALVYAPWYWFVETHGGYGRLLEHHGGYVDGPLAWPANWRQQMAQTVALSGSIWGAATWGGFAWALAWGVGEAVRGRATARGWKVACGVLMLVLVASLAPEFSWWIGLLALPALARSPGGGRRVLGASWLLMTLMTPLYHPYARLWLPLHATGWVMGAWALAGGELAAIPWARPRRVLPIAMAVAAAAHLALFPRATPLPELLRPTDGLRVAARRLADGPLADGPDGRRPTLSTYLRPPLRFYLVESRLDFHRLATVAYVPRERPLVHFLLIDEAQAPDWRPTQLDQPGEWFLFATARPGPATLLDLDPSAAFGQSPFQRRRPDGAEGLRLWLLRGGR